MSKERLTVMLCTNSVSEKESAVVINKSFQPRCFKNTDLSRLGIKWFANKKAWMTTDVFTTWIKQFNSKMSAQKKECFVTFRQCYFTSRLKTFKCETAISSS